MLLLLRRSRYAAICQMVFMQRDHDFPALSLGPILELFCYHFVPLWRALDCYTLLGFLRVGVGATVLRSTPR